jgi:hypothetical protein
MDNVVEIGTAMQELVWKLIHLIKFYNILDFVTFLNFRLSSVAKDMGM